MPVVDMNYTPTETDIPLYSLDLDRIPLKDADLQLEFPFFLLAPKATPLFIDSRTSKTHYQDDNGNELTIYPHIDYGYPTQYDKHLLIYIISQIVHKLRNSNDPEPPRKFNLYIKDFLEITGKSNGGDRYRQLDITLERLRGCLFTLVKRSKNREIHNSKFSLIDYAVANRKSTEGFSMIEITINDWLLGILREYRDEVLTLHRDYFTLSSPLEQRLYEIGRKFCGSKKHFQMGTRKLRQRCGSDSALNIFHSKLNAIILKNGGCLLNYRISLDKTKPRSQKFIFECIDSTGNMLGDDTGPRGSRTAPSKSSFDEDRNNRNEKSKKTNLKPGNCNDWKPSGWVIDQLDSEFGNFRRASVLNDYRRFVSPKWHEIQNPDRHFLGFARTNLARGTHVIPVESDAYPATLMKVARIWFENLPANTRNGLMVKFRDCRGIYMHVGIFGRCYPTQRFPNHEHSENWSLLIRALGIHLGLEAGTEQAYFHDSWKEFEKYNERYPTTRAEDFRWLYFLVNDHVQKN